MTEQLSGKSGRGPARIILLMDYRESPTVKCHQVLTKSSPPRERLPLCSQGKYMQRRVRVLKCRKPLLSFELKVVKQFESLMSN